MMDVVVGWDSREPQTYRACIESIRSVSPDINIIPLKQGWLRDSGMYTRPVDKKAATEFSLTRFLAPFLSDSDTILFCDGDFVFTSPLEELADLADDRFAVQVVKHDHEAKESVKMDGQVQHMYPRKWWSALMLFNKRHPANESLTVYAVNNHEPSWLHRFGWVPDKHLGELPHSWHWLDGYDGEVPGFTPKGIHYTLGTPELGNESISYRYLWDRHATVSMVK